MRSKTAQQWSVIGVSLPALVVFLFTSPMAAQSQQGMVLSQRNSGHHDHQDREHKRRCVDQTRHQQRQADERSQQTFQRPIQVNTGKLFDGAIAPLPMLIVDQGLKQMSSAEIRPQSVTDPDLCVSDLPQQEVRNS